MEIEKGNKAMDVTRKKLQGVLNILSFNRHFYAIGIPLWVLIAAGLTLFKSPTIWILMVNLAFVYGLIMPLIISAYVYDFSKYYDLKWIKSLQLTDDNPKVLVNINAGFDETSFLLKSHFPEAELIVFDFYNAKQHTEPAIVRARKVSLTYPNTQQINSSKIPLNDNAVDIIFLLSAAHEIRSQKEKVAFLKECRRICKPDGKVITVEHLRDFPNFLAFSIGFTHFFSRSTWEKSFKEAGFSTFEETKFTPFMSIFNCRP